MHDIKLYIDNRESAIKAKIEGIDNIIYKNLDYGDMIIDINDNHLMVIERKTLWDLAASIKDGRYKNQKSKLVSLVQTNCLYYIIEGSIDFTNDNDYQLNGITKKTILSCIINTLVRDNIKVIITKNVDETCDFLKNVYSRILDDPGKYFEERSCEKQVSKQKNTNVTKDTYFVSLLCQIPDISIKTARAICCRFKNMKELYDCLNSLDYESKMKVLQEIYIEDSKGKKRKISEKIFKNIIEYFF